MLKVIDSQSGFRSIIRRYLCCGCAVLSLFTVGCSSSITKAGSSSLDHDIQRNSESFHSFMVGELETKKDNLPKAIENLKRASQLSTVPSPELSSRLALLELKSGNLEKALEQSKRAVSVAPTNGEILALHAGILEALNRPDEARQFYARAAAVDKEAIEPLIMEAALLIKEGKVSEGQALLDQAIKKNPSAVPVYIFSARAYEESGQIRLASTRAKKAYAISQGAPDVGLELVRILLKEEKLGEAKSLCEEILKKSPETSLARRVLAQLLVGENRLEGALAQLEIVEKTDTDPTQAQIGIALLELQRKNFASAITKLNLVLVKKPDDGQVLFALANALSAANESDKAIETVKKIPVDAVEYEQGRVFAAVLLRKNNKLAQAITIIEELRDTVPFNPQVELYLASLYKEARDNQTVRTILEALFEKQEPNDRLLFDYAVVLHDLGDSDAVVVALEKALALNSSNVDALNFLAYELAQRQSSTQQEFIKADALVKRALILKPNNGFILDTAAWVAFRQNDIERARLLIQKAIAVTPDDPILLDHAAQIFEAAKMPDRVRSVCEQAIALVPKDDEASAAIANCRKRIN